MYLGNFSFCISDHKAKHKKPWKILRILQKTYRKLYLSCCSVPLCSVATRFHLKREYWRPHSRSRPEIHTVFNSVVLLLQTCTTSWSSQIQFVGYHIKFSNWIMISQLVLLGGKCSGSIIYKIIGYFPLLYHILKKTGE